MKRSLINAANHALFFSGKASRLFPPIARSIHSPPRALVRTPRQATIRRHPPSADEIRAASTTSETIAVDLTHITAAELSIRPARPLEIVELHGARFMFWKYACLIIDGSGRLWRGPKPSPVFPMLPWRWPVVRPASGRVLGLVVDFPQNYYHWMLELLTAVAGWAGQDDGSRFDALLHPPLLRRFQRETLDLIPPLRNLPRIEIPVTHQLRVEQAVVPANGYPSIDAIRTLRSWFLPAAAPLRSGGSRVFISRSDANGRRLLNQPELEQEIARRGFQILRLETLGFPEQVALFADAEVVIGPHGAGFANAIFCPPGATLGELFGPDYHPSFFCSLAARCGLRYGAYRARGPAKFGRFGQRGGDFAVPREEFHAWLDRLGV